MNQTAASESVISEAGEKLLEEESSTLETESFIKLQEALTRQYEEYIRDLEEDRHNLRKRVEELEAEKTSTDDEVKDLEQMLESKCARITQLKESLNITNDKHSKLLREDLEKNYRIIEQEGKIEDLETENKRLKDENACLKATIEALQSPTVLAAEEPPVISAHTNGDPFIEDKNLKTEIALLDKDVAALKEQFALNRTKRSRTLSVDNDQIEFLNMRTLKKLPKKRKIEIKKTDPVSGDYVVETTFLDTSTSSPDRTILEEASPRRGSFFKSLFRTSVR